MFPAINQAQNRFGVDAANLVFTNLDTNGDGSGSIDITGDYSVTPEVFYYEVPAGKQATLDRLVLLLSDAGNFSAAGYGAGAALTNGIHISIHDENDVEIKLLTPVYIKTNAEWFGCACSSSYIEFGNGDNFLAATWDLSSAGSPLILKPEYTLRAEVNDNFTGLVYQRVWIHGYLLDA